MNTVDIFTKRLLGLLEMVGDEPLTGNMLVSAIEQSFESSREEIEEHIKAEFYRRIQEEASWEDIH